MHSSFCVSASLHAVSAWIEFDAVHVSCVDADLSFKLEAIAVLNRKDSTYKGISIGKLGAVWIPPIHESHRFAH
ncbi:hypothetical protein SLEP1_g4077 [Rubroshorea leprosula]|uniref:Uncharacterized protein n=1 Tax=Rubroshorea leprosula TaxID=152421 RepID=A0AAV5HRX0_9ROSI|nr:hypothetical protein SLEP1_g4077 [Rubroshorea leprosula]